ncbi:hypothetical protein M0R89_11610 [Halorussus limi]|uniref:Uncharacterized protein n=1 Tax=Halorussus limi TaxID=2938695 RepID=A0A8U0HRA9_9EURY|nr:hypothetical protein [Halorussus limi]UPV73194.1 hypothetical protein M0R89_11610 [Halorussus limi]
MTDDDTQPDDEMTEYEVAVIDDRLAEIEDEDKQYSTDEVADDLDIDLDGHRDDTVSAEDIAEATGADLDTIEQCLAAAGDALAGDDEDGGTLDVRSAEEIARKSGADLETVRDEIDAMRRRSGDPGEVTDYRDTRWSDDEGLPRVDAGEAADRLPSAADFEAEIDRAVEIAADRAEKLDDDENLEDVDDLLDDLPDDEE